MRKRKGSITIFLILLFSSLLLVVGALRLSLMQEGARMMCRLGARQSLYHMFSNYHRELFDSYDLLYLDAGFSTAALSPGPFLKDASVNAGMLWGASGSSEADNLYGLSAPTLAFDSYTLATDRGGASVYNQMILWADTLPGLRVISLVEELSAGGAEEKAEEIDVKKACDDYDREVDRALEGKSREEEDNSDTISDTAAHGTTSPDLSLAPAKKVDNPIKTVKKLLNKGVLALVLPEGFEVSDAKAEAGTLLSKRKLNQGLNSTAGGVSFGPAAKVKMTAYLTAHLNCLNGREEGSQVLAGELEYVYAGKTSDEENLKKVANRLLLLREGANLLYLEQNPKKRSEVTAMASAIAASLALPVAEEVIAQSLMVCWAYGESLLDVRVLFGGGKVPPVKTDATWQLELTSLARVDELLDTGKSGNAGLTYKQYLSLLLLGEPADRLLRRSMDMIEQGVRKKAGTPDFHLDCCIGSAEAVLTAVSRGRTFRAKEERSYEW